MQIKLGTDNHHIKGLTEEIVDALNNNKKIPGPEGIEFTWSFNFDLQKLTKETIAAKNYYHLTTGNIENFAEEVASLKKIFAKEGITFVAN